MVFDLLGRFTELSMQPKKVYLASTFGRREEMEHKALDLPAIGMTEVSTWIHGGEDGLTRADVAVLDITDVDRADVVIVFTSPRHSPVGGGHLWEFGYAYARGKRCVVIGPESTVFVLAPRVEHYDFWEDFLDHERAK